MFVDRDNILNLYVVNTSLGLPASALPTLAPWTAAEEPPF